MAQKFTDITLACEGFLLSLAEGRYYDAHEDLERIWFPRRFDKEDEVALWKGFINAAVSFELIQRGRQAASEKAWETYLKYLPIMDRIVTPHKELYDKIVQHIETIKVHHV